jgi:hypothetical protein
MERRTFIAATAVLPLIAIPATAAPIDPLVGLWADRQHLLAAWSHEIQTNPAAGNWDTPKCLRLKRGQSETERALCSTPATTIEGLAAQLEYARSEFDEDVRGNWTEPYASIFDALVAGAKQLAGEV